MCFRDNNYLGRLQNSKKKKLSFSIYLRRRMLHICLVYFTSFISFTNVHLFILCTKVQLIHFVIHFHLIHFTDHLIHIHHVWFYSYCIVFQPHCVFHFLNQSRLWKLIVSLDKISIRNIYCII